MFPLLKADLQHTNGNLDAIGVDRMPSLAIMAAAAHPSQLPRRPTDVD